MYNFTNSQKEAVDGIIQFIATPFNASNYIIGLVGAGGTGKTFITKYIIDNCIYSNSVIQCTSPTHKACRVFSEALDGKKVSTIQSVFGLRLDLKLEDFNPENPQFNPKASPKLDNIKLLVIDESSMLPAGLVTYICKTCKELGIKILFIGDNSQLAPVNEKKSIAFDRCVTIYTLTEIVRQGSQNPINNILSLLRENISGDNNDWTFMKYILKNPMEYNELDEGYCVCNPAKFKELIDMKFCNEEYTHNIDMYRVIAYTNDKVSTWNHYIRNTIIKDADKNIITKNDLIMSYQTIVNDFLETIINNSEEYIVNDIVDYVDTKYGIKGLLVKFQMIHGGNITKPLFIVDHRDKYSIQMYHKIANNLITAAKNATGGTRVSRWKDYYSFKKSYLLAINIFTRDKTKLLYSRDIDYGFALTAHKSQGSTYDTVFVDLNDMIYKKTGGIYSNYDDVLRRIYVGCSRASKELIICYGQ